MGKMKAEVLQQQLETEEQVPVAQTAPETTENVQPVAETAEELVA